MPSGIIGLRLGDYKTNFAKASVGIPYFGILLHPNFSLEHSDYSQIGKYIQEQGKLVISSMRSNKTKMALKEVSLSSPKVDKRHMARPNLWTQELRSGASTGQRRPNSLRREGQAGMEGCDRDMKVDHQLQALPLDNSIAIDS